jgi:D-lyxose ketol-isomerase
MPKKELVEIKQTLGPGECYHIKPGLIHRFWAEKGDVVLAEVSTYHPEDVVRLEDDYKR